MKEPTIDAEKSRCWFRYDASVEHIEQELRRNASHVRYARLSCDDFFCASRLDGLELNQLRDFAIGSLVPLKQPFVQQWFEGLTSLERLEVRYFKYDPSLLEFMANSSWWPRLRSFEARCVELEPSTAWSNLWNTQPLALELLSICHVDSQLALDVTYGKLPQIRRIAFAFHLGDEFLQSFSMACLPQLVEIDLQYNSFSCEALRAFLKSHRAGLPNLRQIGIRFPSDRSIEHVDWNGSVVNHGVDEMTDGELRDAFFRDTNLVLAPYDVTLAQKMDSQLYDIAFGRFLELPTKLDNSI